MDLSPTVQDARIQLQLGQPMDSCTAFNYLVERPRPDIDDYDVRVLPPDPFALYGGGEHGFRHVYADLRRAMRLCCRDPADNYHYEILRVLCTRPGKAAIGP